MLLEFCSPNKACTVTFLCPMRFTFYPLDSHVCKFRVGSTNFDDRYMRFSGTFHNNITKTQKQCQLKWFPL